MGGAAPAGAADANPFAEEAPKAVKTTGDFSVVNGFLVTHVSLTSCSCKSIGLVGAQLLQV